MADAQYVYDSQAAILVVYGADAAPQQLVRASSLAALVVFSAQTFAKHVNASQLAGLVPYAVVDMTSPFASQAALLVVYGTGTAGNARSRAWTFTLDGHVFYVLDLGEEGTFLYDITTKQWCEFQTSGYDGWNMRFGTMWGGGSRIAGADSDYGVVWELDPDETLDAEFRDIEHIATGFLMSRSRVFRAVEHVTVAGSNGGPTSPDGATMSLRWSDDQGNTWSDYQVIDLEDGSWSQEIAWRSLGAFKAPGRLFEISDIGGLVRIDGADAGIDNFDEDTTPSTGQ